MSDALTDEEVQKLEVLRFVLALHMYESWRQSKDAMSRDTFKGLLRDIAQGDDFAFSERGGNERPATLEFAIDFFRPSQDMVFLLEPLLAHLDQAADLPDKDALARLKEVRAVNGVHLVRSLSHDANIILVMPGALLVFNVGKREGAFYAQQQGQAKFDQVSRALAMLLGHAATADDATISPGVMSLDEFFLTGGLLNTNPVNALWEGTP